MYPEQRYFTLYFFLNDNNVNNNDDNKSQYLRTNTAIHFNVWRILPCVILLGTWNMSSNGANKFSTAERLRFAFKIRKLLSWGSLINRLWTNRHSFSNSSWFRYGLYEWQSDKTPHIWWWKLPRVCTTAEWQSLCKRGCDVKF